MKIRTDFVTNSSSSSFVLCFDSENDWNNFVKYCLDFNYEEILKLVKNIDSSDNYEFYGYKSREEFILTLLESASDHKELLEDSYDKAEARVKSAYKTVAGEIWDSDGGLLEWAIRNKFLSSEFRWNCLVDWQIG